MTIEHPALRFLPTDELRSAFWSEAHRLLLGLVPTSVSSGFPKPIHPEPYFLQEAIKGGCPPWVRLTLQNGFFPARCYDFVADQRGMELIEALRLRARELHAQRLQSGGLVIQVNAGNCDAGLPTRIAAAIRSQVEARPKAPSQPAFERRRLFWEDVPAEWFATPGRLRIGWWSGPVPRRFSGWQSLTPSGVEDVLGFEHSVALVMQSRGQTFYINRYPDGDGDVPAILRLLARLATEARS